MKAVMKSLEVRGVVTFLDIVINLSFVLRFNSLVCYISIKQFIISDSKEEGTHFETALETAKA